MNYKFTALTVMASVVILLSSCLNGSSDYTSTTYDDALITSFALGSVKCQRTIQKSDGTDSTYTYTYSASSYAMSIDQLHDSIFNIQPLIYGTMVDKVLTTIYTQNNGTVLVQNLKEADSDTITWNYYSSSDSLDYTQDRLFRVWSSDGSTFKDYTVHVNVSDIVNNSVTWGTADSCYMDAAYSSLSSCVLDGNGKMYAMFKGNGGNTLYSRNDGGSWVEQTPANGMSLDSVIVAANGKLYVMHEDSIYESIDGTSWKKTDSQHAYRNLCGGDDDMLLALNADGKISRLENDGTEFNEETIEDETYNNVSVFLPCKDINVVSTTLKTNDDIKRYTIVANGNVAGDTCAVVWNKIEDSEKAQPWTLTVFNERNHNYRLPDMQGLSAVYLNDGILAIGGKTSCSVEVTPFSCLYYSPDSGATWHTDSSITLPDDYTTDGVKSARLLSEGKTLYLLVLYEVDGKSQVKVWKAKLNKIDDSQYYYE